MLDTLTVPIESPTLRLLIADLKSGDHLDQPTFHARYRRTPPGFRAELIGGVVIVPSPVGNFHSEFHWTVVGWLRDYASNTPGVQGRICPTVILGPDSEPQPDVVLVIAPDRGGQTRVERSTEEGEEYLAGPPELVAEIASSSVAYDLHSKKRDYERWGVAEYLVMLAKEREVKWYCREKDAFVDLKPATDGTLRSRVFPGLWLDREALVARDDGKLSDVLRQGMGSEEHSGFIQKLEQRGTPAQ